jgi:hypothetical protein
MILETVCPDPAEVVGSREDVYHWDRGVPLPEEAE